MRAQQAFESTSESESGMILFYDLAVFLTFTYIESDDSEAPIEEAKIQTKQLNDIEEKSPEGGLQSDAPLSMASMGRAAEMLESDSLVLYL